MLHVPVQQPEPTEHASPGCAQKEDAWQVPLAAQCFEQHVASDVQLLPTVEQLELSAEHVPPAQFWLQHWPLDVHAALSATHAGYWQTPPTQSPLQQSPFAVHPAPSLRQAPLPVKTPGKSAPGPPALPEPPAPPEEPCPFPEPPSIKKLPEPAPPSPPTRFDVCAPQATTTASAMAPKSATPVRFREIVCVFTRSSFTHCGSRGQSKRCLSRTRSVRVVCAFDVRIRRERCVRRSRADKLTDQPVVDRLVRTASRTHMHLGLLSPALAQDTALSMPCSAWPR